jgi:S-DNA-T family DNA segregation ATPase FtsK/SpoIIIE
MGRTTVRGTSLWAWVLGGLFGAAGWVIVKVFMGVGWLGYRLLLWALAHPRTSLSIGVLSGAVLLIGWKWVVGIVGCLLLTGSIWKAAHRESFEATIGAWLRTWHRKWWTYRRRWESVMTRCGLRLDIDDEQHYPELKKVSTTQYWDRLTLRMQVGQELGDYESASERLRNAFRSERLSVQEIEPGVVGVDLMRRDPFRHGTVPAAPMPSCTAEIDWSALPVGIDEYLRPLTVSVVGGHLVGGGDTGAGKAGIEWNVLRRLAPAIADGTCKPVFIDPKARELRQGIELVDAGTFGTTKDNGLEFSGDYAVTCEDTLALLQRLAAEVAEANLAGGDAGERDFVPSKRTPLRPIFIDELAPLYAYWPRTERDKIEKALGIILTQGRASGRIVIGVIQEVTKDIFTQRSLYQRRIGLRLPDEDATEALLTDNAAGRGAECHRIPESLPGVCFSFKEGDGKAIRARLGHVRDEDIAELVAYVQALREVPSIAPEQEPIAVEYIDEAEAGQIIEAA